MARYIDADALKKRLDLVRSVADDLYGMGINRGLDRAETEIDMLPTADVVEVVRCKDCKYYHLTHLRCVYAHHNGIINVDGYCSYGERR